MKRIAIIGGGISGLSCALQLDPEHFEVTIFDKGRGHGGRVSTKRIDQFHFDHGAQYLSDTASPFRLVLDDWLTHEVIKPWEGRLGELKGSKLVPTFDGKPAYVGNPKMSQIGNYLADKLKQVTFHKSTRINSVFKKFNEWYLMDASDEIYGGYDFVVVAIPPPQAKHLLKDFDYLVSILDSVDISPRWVLLAGLKHKMSVQYDGVFVNDSSIRWMARNNSKPNRPDTESWVVHASREWSIENLDKDKDWVAKALYDEFLNITGFEKFDTEFRIVHLWKYAIVDKPLNQNFVLDNNRNVGLCGDYCIGNNIEAAYISGDSLGQRLAKLRI